MEDSEALKGYRGCQGVSGLVGERTGLTVKVTFDHKAEGGERKNAGQWRAEWSSRRGGSLVETQRKEVPGTSPGLRLLWQNDEEKGQDRSQGRSRVSDQSCPCVR